MRNISTLFFTFLIFNVYCQTGEWTWVSGDSVKHTQGNFGPFGVPGINYVPPALYEPSEWKDTSGNFWIFGGYHYDSTSLDTVRGDRNELWRYEPSTNCWTLMNGSRMQNNAGHFSAYGISSPLNIPACRGWGTPSWTDLNNNLWLYAGRTNFNDMWKYDILINEWTLMQGNVDTTLFTWHHTEPVYGTYQVPGSSNTPGSRVEVSATWTDKDGNLWLFGGEGDTTDYEYNDLWKYNTTTNEWAWMNGPNYPYDAGYYGIKGIASPLNRPSARCAYAKWKDQLGNFYLFGGAKLEFIPNCFYKSLNDVWKYDIGINCWTWLGGDSTFNTLGSGTSQCTDDITNIPKSGWENRAVCFDSCGNVFLFGGLFVDCNGAIYNTSNELWHYNSVNNKWTLISAAGSPVWGTKGIGAPANHPPGLCGSVAWLEDNSVWIFAGTEEGNSESYNTLWKFSLDTFCFQSACNTLLQPQANFFISDSSICSNDCINLTNLSQNSSSYEWIFNGATISSSTDESPQNICFPSSGIFEIKLIAYNSNGSDTLTVSNLVKVNPSPTISPLFQSGDTLFSQQGFESYQWYEDTILIPGSSSYQYIPNHSGNYSILITDSNGCEGLAGLLGVLAGIENPQDNFAISVFPNPTNSDITLLIKSKKNSSIAAVLIDEDKKTVWESKLNLKNGINTLHLNTSKYSNGNYFLQLYNNEKSFSRLIRIIH